MFWLPLFWLRGRCHLNVTGLFFLFTFKISLSLVFGSLVIMCLGMAFFVFICFVSAKFFYIWGLKSFFSFGHYIFNLFFCSIISLFFKTYSYIYIGLFSISSLVIDIIVGFCGFFFFSLLAPIWVISIDLSSAVSSLLSSPANEFFCFSYCLIHESHCPISLHAIYSYYLLDIVEYVF